MALPKNILFLVPYPLHRAPSQRFRVELYLPILQAANIPFKVETFLDNKTGALLYSNASTFKKALGVLRGFLKRFYVVFFVVTKYQYVFVHREASPIGPPLFEFIICKVWKKKLIYDFDDAIWIPNTSQENKIVRWIKAFWKVKFICRWAYKVVGGNKYLCSYARQFNPNAFLIPTCVDVVEQHNTIKDQSAGKVTIGWTGSHSTMKYLDQILPVLKRISNDFPVELVIISNNPPQFQLPNMRFIPWQEKTEVKDLLNIHIGIMPLQADPWCEGKCGFKAIQYMALGIPALASPVGVNKRLVQQGVNGFLCTTPDEWYNALALLIKQEGVREKMGREGRKKIVEEYSVQANAECFLALFD